MRAERMKGAAGEREIVALLRMLGWPEARRTSDGRRQLGRGDITDGPEGCHIEVKRQERLNVPAALRQVEDDARPTDTPILLHRSSRQPWLATLPAEDLLALLKVAES